MFRSVCTSYLGALWVCLFLAGVHVADWSLLALYRHAMHSSFIPNGRYRMAGTRGEAAARGCTNGVPSPTRSCADFVLCLRVH